MRRGRRPPALRVVHLVVLAFAVVLGVALAGGAQGSAPQPVAEASAPAAPGVEHSLSVDGTSHTYRSYAPPGTVARLPLLVVLHGRGQLPADRGHPDRFPRARREGRAVAVYPDGVGRSWNAGQGCCGIAGAGSLPDTAFVAAVVANAVHELPVDPGRVYLVGYSNGGKLAYSAACTRPQLFAAMATYGSVPLQPCPAGAPDPGSDRRG